MVGAFRGSPFVYCYCGCAKKTQANYRFLRVLPSSAAGGYSFNGTPWRWINAL
jgi:hypothetical protein